MKAQTAKIIKNEITVIFHNVYVTSHTIFECPAPNIWAIDFTNSASLLLVSDDSISATFS